ncbi:polymorphic toxin type 44 domain-containing protein [uncultured Roseivirga sp.]|uniref:polymorphic toxin type 44 domain-containing protein n=1 Tax=uncultured Roseivirga sp. TaxID=543088 RepID=UPI0032B1C607
MKAFKRLVETGGTYDLKNSGQFKTDLRKHLKLEDGDLLPGTFTYRGKGGYQLQDLGNYNFGVLANAAGYSNNFSQFGAGIYQILSGTSSSRWWLSSIGSQLLYGDDPRDAYFIQLGFHHLWN